MKLIHHNYFENNRAYRLIRSIFNSPLLGSDTVLLIPRITIDVPIVPTRLLMSTLSAVIDISKTGPGMTKSLPIYRVARSTCRPPLQLRTAWSLVKGLTRTVSATLNCIMWPSGILQLA
jgi:hypothetical protein